MELNSISKELIKLALEEDIASGDVTSLSTISENAEGQVNLLAKQSLRLCGQDVAEAVIAAGASSLQYKRVLDEGSDLESMTTFATIEGRLRDILSLERTILNFLQRLSGIATQTRALCGLVSEYDVQLLDTRKTIPGFRQLDKYAVSVGGGVNHRIGLFDAFLIKDNHIDAVGGDVARAICACRENNPKNLPLQVEVRSLEELTTALDELPDMILLDNMTPELMAEAVALTRAHSKASKTLLEASGGINQHTVAAYAATGVDRISTGMLTHSVPAADISMKYAK
ncbi:UNVERIFIED_CONTAM: hypothetical protein GTU68_038008 [Idotea baltica]|nr:hypothetical protein [Idotea baltica]